MSQPSSPARPTESHDAQPRPPSSSGPRREPPEQIWKVLAFALGVLLLAVTLFFLTRDHASEEAQAPQEQEQVTEEPEAKDEEEEEEEKPKTAPPPAAVTEDPRPAPRSGSATPPPPEPPAAPAPPALANVRVLSVGYSPAPGRRVVALRIGGGLPYFLREGDTIGDMKILAILTDRVQVSQGGKTYEIMVAP